MRASITDVLVRNIKPPARGSATIFDTTLRGLCLRVSAGGAKSFCLLQGKDRKRTYLGKYPAMSLADARVAARRLIAMQTLGIVHQEPSIRFDEAIGTFLVQSEQRNRPRTTHDYRRLLTRHFLASLGSRQLHTITTQDVTRLVDRMLRTPSEYLHALAAVKIFFRWASRAGLIQHNPCEHLKPLTRVRPRERVLTEGELYQIYTTARSAGYRFGIIVQLLILTGQRRTEIGSLRWEYIDLEKRIITLPSSATKNKHSHTFPYGRMVERLLSDVPCFGSYLFPGNREEDVPVAGWSNFKSSFDKKCQIAPWTLHDLRRTFATNLAALGVRMEVTERLLNHVSGSFGGIVGVYQRHGFQDEMRVAIEAWEAKLAHLVGA